MPRNTYPGQDPSLPAIAVDYGGVGPTGIGTISHEGDAGDTARPLLQARKDFFNLTMGLTDVNTSAAPPETEREPSLITIINEHTLLANGEYMPLFTHHMGMLEVLHEAHGPVSIGQLIEQMSFKNLEPPNPNMAKYVRQLARKLNSHVGHAAILETGGKGGPYLTLDSSIDIAQAAAMDEFKGQYKDVDLYSRIIDIAPLGLPADPENQPVVIEIIGDNDIRVDGREVRLRDRSHSLYLFNAHVICRGFATAKELKELGFLPQGSGALAQKETVLQGQLNRGGQPILRSDGKGTATVHGLSYRIRFIDLRGNPAVPHPNRERARRRHRVTPLAKAAGSLTVSGSQVALPDPEEAAVEQPSELAETYLAVKTRFDNATMEDKRRALEFEKQIAAGTGLESDLVRDLLILTRLSAATDQSYGLTVEQIATDHMRVVFEEINEALNTMLPPRSMDKILAAIIERRVGIFALHVGLPPDRLSVLQDLHLTRNDGSTVTYADAYAWTRSALRSGEFEHLKNQFQFKSTADVGMIFDRIATEIATHLADRR